VGGKKEHEPDMRLWIWLGADRD